MKTKGPLRLLRPSLLRKTSLYRRRFLRSKPFKHVVIRNVFDPPLVKELRDCVDKESTRLSSQKVRPAYYTFDLGDTQSPLLWKWFKALHLQVSPWIESVAKIKVAKLYLNLQFYVLQNPGYQMRVHSDHKNRFKRAIVFILNLTDLKPGEGGRLLLLSSSKKVVRRIPHRFNSLVIFGVSSKSWHTVEPLRSPKKRLTMGCWLSRREFDRTIVRWFRRLNNI